MKMILLTINVFAPLLYKQLTNTPSISRERQYLSDIYIYIYIYILFLQIYSHSYNNVITVL